MKKCEKCGTDNTDTLSFCTTCGAPLPMNPTPAAPAAPVETPVAPEEPAPVQPVEPIAPVAPVAPVAPAPVEAPAKKADMKSIALILVAAVGLIVGIVGIVLAITSGGDKKPETTDNNQTSQTPATPEVTTATTGTNDGTIVTLGSYTLTIPKSYQYELDNDYLVVTDAGQTWAAGIYYDGELTYSRLASGLGSLVSYLQENGATVAGSGQAEANGTAYYYIDFIDPTDSMAKTYAFFKAGIYTFEVLATNGTTVYDHNIINFVAPIISSAKEKTASRDLGIDIGGKAVKNFDKELNLNIQEAE
jgi:hypothetical protein